MLEQIKDLCLFMICGQTLLYFQSGKKYEKICRMILELLVLAGIVGMILNFLQVLGFQKGEMEAAGGAVAGMQRTMEEALSKQLGMEEFQSDFLSDDTLENLIEKHTTEEIKLRYNSFAKQYGMEITDVKQDGKKLQVFLKGVKEDDVAKKTQDQEIERIQREKTGEETDQTAEISKETEKRTEQTAEISQETGEEAGQKDMEEEAAVNSADIDQVEKIEIEEITIREEESNAGNEEKKEAASEKVAMEKADLETFRRQLALVFAMEEDKLEVILVD